jgi:predicted transcriptional regulator
MVNQTLTNLELQALKSITYSDFYENGRDSILWDYSVYDCCPFTGKTRSGVFSSLVQKGLIYVQEKEKPFRINEKGEKVKNPYYSRDCNFGTIQITKEGYELLDNLKLIDEDGRFIS